MAATRGRLVFKYASSGSAARLRVLILGSNLALRRGCVRIGVSIRLENTPPVLESNVDLQDGSVPH